MPKFWSKNALFWGTVLKKYCHILNQHPRFWPTAKFGDKKKKMTKVGTKSTLFGYFEAAILKKLLSYLKSTPSNLPNSKNFGKKQKCLNQGQKMPCLRILKNYLSYSKPAPTKLSNCKISKKKEMPKFRNKMYYLGIFNWNLKIILSYLK